MLQARVELENEWNCSVRSWKVPQRVSYLTFSLVIMTLALSVLLTHILLQLFTEEIMFPTTVQKFQLRK